MQGFNMGRYRAPDQDDAPAPKRSRGGPAAAAPTVRFEMPFPIWCSTCARPTVIGQGVRFNAEKRRVGSYLSTPVWSFRLRHAECSGEIEMRTDPRNTAYVVVAGARKRETGEDVAREGDAVVIAGGEEREALRRNAFAGLEKTIGDRERAAGAARRVGELEGASARAWDDPYARNHALRRTFRAERKRLEREAGAAGDLRDRLGLGFDLLPPSETDALRASLVEFGASGEGDRPPDRALARPMFAPPAGARPKDTARSRSVPPPRALRGGGGGKLRSEVLAHRRKESLASEIIGNTRVARDPFLDAGRGGTVADAPRPDAKFAGVRRKLPKPVDGVSTLGGGEVNANAVAAAATGLVNYDSE